MATPRKVRGALLPDPVCLLGKELEVFGTDTFLFLEKLESPLVMDGDEGKTQKLRMEDMAILAFVLTRPLKESRTLLARSRADFDEAVSAYAKTIPLNELKTISKTLADYLASAFSTLTGGGEKKTVMEAGE